MKTLISSIVGFIVSAVPELINMLKIQKERQYNKILLKMQNNNNNNLSDQVISAITDEKKNTYNRIDNTKFVC